MRPEYERQNQAGCLFFTKLPLEIREMIYYHLLIAEGDLKSEKRIMGEDRETMRFDNRIYTPAFDLDSRILRTCRAICSEAYPILYGRNTFSFASDNDMVNFKGAELFGKRAFFGPGHTGAIIH